MTEDEMRDRLVAAMQAGGPGNTYAQWAAAVMPTVRAIVAGELRKAVYALTITDRDTGIRIIGDRADALDPT